MCMFYDKPKPGHTYIRTHRWVYKAFRWNNKEHYDENYRLIRREFLGIGFSHVTWKPAPPLDKWLKAEGGRRQGFHVFLTEAGAKSYVRHRSNCVVLRIKVRGTIYGTGTDREHKGMRVQYLFIPSSSHKRLQKLVQKKPTKG